MSDVVVNSQPTAAEAAAGEAIKEATKGIGL